MKRYRMAGIMAAIVLGGAGVLNAQEAASTRLQLQRDRSYEENLRYMASADTAVTPARVLRWINSLMGHPTTLRPSSIEFQPVINSYEHQQQFIVQLAYKF